MNRWSGRAGVCLLLLAALLAGPAPGVAETPLPLVDLHVHYNGWVAADLAPQEAARRLQAHGAIGGVVSSTPTANALRLAARSPGTLVPFFRPYLTEGHRGTWHRDPAVLREAEAALAAGQYRGIGEVHLSAANAGADAGNPILVGLLRLARQHRVPVQVHVDAPEIPVLEALLGAFPTVPVIWAHAGGWAEPGQVEALLVNHPNLWVEFSARDPYRYGGIAPLVEASGGLQPGWATLARRFPDRLMVGSDTSRGGLGPPRGTVRVSPEVAGRPPPGGGGSDRLPQRRPPAGLAPAPGDPVARSFRAFPPGRPARGDQPSPSAPAEGAPRGKRGAGTWDSAMSSGCSF